MQTRPAYATVGLFVIVLAGAVIVAGVWFGFGDPKPPSHPYLTYLTDSVSGLRENSTVRYRGVDVGRVRAIGLDPADPRQVRLLLDIDREVPIQTDTVARLSTQGLTGLSFVELRGNGTGAPLTATPGAPYPVIPSEPSLLGRIDDVGSELLARIDEATRQLTEATRGIALLFDQSNRDAVSASLADLNRLTGTLGARAETIGRGVDDFGRVLAAAAATGERLPGLVEQTEQTLAGLDRHTAALADAARAVERLADTVAAQATQIGGDLGRTTALTEQELARFASETQPAMVQTLRELDRAAGVLSRLGETLERDPARLLYGERQRTLGPGEGGNR
jgi:phospholipid/cholesterol/gamma-HCH transport system substrate-binding protein